MKGSGDKEPLACKYWSKWSKLEHMELRGLVIPLVHIVVDTDYKMSCILYKTIKNQTISQILAIGSFNKEVG